MRLAAVAGTLAALTFARTAATAAADDDVSLFVSRSTALYCVLGIGPPVGELGAEVEQTVLPNWTISAGGGFGKDGAQIAGMTRLLLGNRPTEDVVTAIRVRVTQVA